jgi:hypothetical protein
MTSPDEDVRPHTGDWSEDDLELFGPYQNLYRITVEGRVFWVPEHTVVLRSCQFIEMYEQAVRMPWKDYCWNNTQGCCEMTYREHKDGPELTARACRTMTRPGMEIVKLPKGGRMKK